MYATMKKTWKKSRYGEYYQNVMQPIHREAWKQELKRIKKLKKKLLALGPVPQSKHQIIKTVNMFIKLIDILTEFIDDGVLKYAPESKVEAVLKLNTAIKHFVSRKPTPQLCYLNKSKIGEAVTANNLCIGRFVGITPEESVNTENTTTINGVTLKVIVDYIPAADWLQKKAIASSGNTVALSQSALSSCIEDITKDLIKKIDSVLV